MPNQMPLVESLKVLHELRGDAVAPAPAAKPAFQVAQATVPLPGFAAAAPAKVTIQPAEAKTDPIEKDGASLL